MATAQWRKSLRVASFRGVQFKIEGHELAGGRRGITHEFAQRDKPFGEDTGRQMRRFTVEGFIIGNDYFRERDALIAALEQGGAGELIHPYLGRQIVNCFGGFRLRESSRDGGMAIFTMQFEEAGEIEFPSVASDSSYLIDQASSESITRAKTDFSDKFSVAGLPSFVMDDAARRINGFADLLDKASGKYSARNSSLATLAYATRNLRSSVRDLAQSPSRLADQMAENMRLLTEISNAPREVFNSLGSLLFGFGEDEKAVPLTTSTRRAQAGNADALNNFIQIVAVSEAARVATEVEYESTEDAASARDLIADKLDEKMDTAENDETFSALQDLRAQVVKGVPPADQNLANIATISNQLTLPSLVIAYDLYESQEFEQDLINRNKVKHPGFVPGGKDLEVLQVE